MMDEQILSEALLELQEYLVKQFPQPTEEDYNLPLRFRRRMKRLIQKHGHPTWYFIRKTVAIVAALAFLFVGLFLGFNENARANVWEWILERVPIFARDSIQIPMVEGYNQYILNYTEYGIFYYVQTGSSMQDYYFYFQPYSGAQKTMCLFEKKGGYMKDLSAVKKKDGLHYVIMWVDDNAGYISEYDPRGRLLHEVILDEQGFEIPGQFPLMRALPEGGYLIGLMDVIYVVQEDGTIPHTFSIGEGQIRNLVALEDGRKFAVFQDLRGGAISVSQLDLERETVKATRCLPVFEERLSVFGGDRLVYCTEDRAYLFDMDETKDEVLLDLKKHNIVASQIQGIYGSSEDILLVSVDTAENVKRIRALLHLQKDGGEELATAEGYPVQPEGYAADGRKVIRLAMFKDDDDGWVIDYRARKYSQESEDVTLEVELFDGTPEDYLASGEKPDIMLLENQTQIAPLVKEGFLAKLDPLCERQERYTVGELLPKVREQLSVDGDLYALAKSFRLLVYSSDGSNLDVCGKCTVTDYLKWYDAYVTEKELDGMSDLSLLIYAALPEFYDETTGTADFDAEEFKKLMMAYKEVRDGHAGEQTPYDAGIAYTLEEIVERKTARGPSWMGEMLTESQLVDPDQRLYGLPTREGTGVAYMRIERPLVILADSESQEEALDFILYACRTKTREYANMGGGVGEREENEYQTHGYFWTFEDYLKEDIWETEKDHCWAIHYTVPTVGSQFEGITAGFTQEHKEMLRDLLNAARGITKTQQDIYGMFLEEMDGYLSGDEDLDECRDELQDRVIRYLARVKSR